ncbi:MULTISPECIES: M48 family metalloprotease [Streptomyces]|uniref:M48 family metalloprotease n=1 Tax=Streptomyces koelreuteriae TaxID=2838015 RepID=A0ABX8FRB8_9ACTN|nr:MULTISPECIES: M48 family metalloprotease [Streptomyces]QWB23681.1 M48 family metalloprotease [Streptomyces koelreuteriae]UUA06651.1 M48 family metalloprotease [Streptomyces koelreuteriae]UUA14280.1 M48 family metalloprotease [Streptomyces sp. CRCS-T-1]
MPISAPVPDDDLTRRPGRIHIAARRRGADLTALGSLALHLPHVAASLTVVFVVSYALSHLIHLPWWLLFGSWVLSGALVFHRPCERLLARWLFGLRYPTPEEDRRLRPVWHEVTARAGVDAKAYQLWMEESDEINALAAAGHIVGVTSHSLRTLTPAQLAGVLAHELGHHTRGHAWASLLSLWYALPARLAWRLLRLLCTRLGLLPTGAAAVVIGVAGALLIALATATYGLVFLPLATPYLVAAVSRRSELRADEHAAGLGFAPQLMAVLHQERDREVTAGVPGPAFSKGGMIARLLDSHPDVHTRLHRLQAHLDSRR